MDILACSIDGYFPLVLHVFDESDEVIAGLLFCPKCFRWYPIQEKLPQMLPDEMRNKNDEISFLSKWKDIIPKEILTKGKPFSLYEKFEKK